MATTIEKSAVTREVLVRDYRRDTVTRYIARFASEGVYLREKGKRTEYGPVPWERVLRSAEMLAADALIAEKKPVRRVRRGLL